MAEDPNKNAKKARMAPEEQPSSTTKEKPSPLGKIEMGNHFVRLKFAGDKSTGACANLGTKLYKKYVYNEKHFVEGSDSIVDVEAYKRSLAARLKKEGVDEEPVFVRAALYDSKREPFFDPAWFKNFLPDQPPVCVDALNNLYFEVTDEHLKDDLQSSRKSGQTRQKERNKRERNDGGEQHLTPPVATPPRTPSGVTSSSSSWHPGHSSSFSSSAEMAAPVTPAPAPNNQGILPPINITNLAPGGAGTVAFHKSLRERIEACTTAKACVNVYEGAEFQECIDVLRDAKQHYFNQAPADAEDLMDKWAKYWADGMIRGDAWAKVLEKCRKSATLLLFKVCNIWNFLGEKEEEPEDRQALEDFENRRIHQIIMYTLPMDRANCLYHMAEDRDAVVPVRGLYWYSKFDENARLLIEPSMGKNPFGPSINKRYIALYYEFYPGNERIGKWLQIAFPPRVLQGQPPPQMNHVRLKQSRDAALDTMLQKVRAKRAAADEGMRQWAEGENAIDELTYQWHRGGPGLG